MTGFEIERVPFDETAVAAWGEVDRRHQNWPVVYTIAGRRQAYVGQTGNPAARLRQYLKTPAERDAAPTSSDSAMSDLPGQRRVFS